jgi:RHS repeat-associated protein
VYYLYDMVGNMIASYTVQGSFNSQTNTGAGSVTDRWTYEYDDRNRLIKATHDVPTTTPGGTIVNVGGYAAFSRQLEVVYRYDADNNLIGRFEIWNSPPSPIVFLGGAYAYPGNDRYGNALNIPAGYQASNRFAWPVRTLSFLYDGNQVGAYYQDGGVLTRLVWGPGLDNLVARQTTAYTASATGTKWYLTDSQGSVLGLINTQNYNDATGRPVANNDGSPVSLAGTWAKIVTYNGGGADRAWGQNFVPNANPFIIGNSFNEIQDEFEYTGRLYDYTTQLQNNRSRWLNPGTGQFMGKDSWGYGAGDSNLYRYAHGDWANNTDPSGHFVSLISTMVALTLTLTGGTYGTYYAGYTGRKGHFDPDRALAGLVSGSEIGGGLGMMFIGGPFGAVAGGTFFNAGMQSAAQSGLFTPGASVNWSGYFMGQSTGMLGGYISSVVGLIPVPVAPALTGSVGNFLDQYMAGGQVNWSQVLMAGLTAQASAWLMNKMTGSMRTPGRAQTTQAGSVTTKTVSPGGQVSCTATAGPLGWLKWVGLHTVGGAIGGGLSYAGNYVTGNEPWDDNAFLQSVGLGAATSAAAAHGEYNSNRVCFVAGTPLLTPEGSKAIETFQPGDLVLSRDENEPEGRVEAKVVEEVFRRFGPVMELEVGDRKIGTTAEHPFWVRGKGWLPAAQMVVGDHLLGADGRWSVVTARRDTGQWAPLYNLRIAHHRTYFVGCVEWGLSAWAHNACTQGEFEKEMMDRGFSRKAATTAWNRFGLADPATADEGGLRAYLTDNQGNPRPQLSAEQAGALVDLVTSAPKQAASGSAPSYWDGGDLPVGGPNPNGLRQRVVDTPTPGEGGVYLKPEETPDGMRWTKVGSTEDFAERYGRSAENAIEVEIRQTVNQKPPGVDDSEYEWTAERQRRFDEEYVDRMTPPEARYRDPDNPKSPVSTEKWARYRQIFGYGSLPENFGY